MRKNDGTTAAMEPCKTDTTMATFVRYIFCGGNKVGDTSQKKYATRGQGPHTLNQTQIRQHKLQLRSSRERGWTIKKMSETKKGDD